MKRKRFSVEQIVSILKQAELGMPVAEVNRRVGVSEQTFYRWKKQYSGMEVDQLRQLKQLQDENGRLKKLVAELTLDRAMLQDVLPPHSLRSWGPRRSQKNGEALTAARGGGVHARRLSGQPAPRVSSRASSGLDATLRESARSSHSVANADAGAGEHAL